MEIVSPWYAAHRSALPGFFSILGSKSSTFLENDFLVLCDEDLAFDIDTELLRDERDRFDDVDTDERDFLELIVRVSEMCKSRGSERKVQDKRPGY